MSRLTRSPALPGLAEPGRAGPRHAGPCLAALCPAVPRLAMPTKLFFHKRRTGARERAVGMAEAGIPRHLFPAAWARRYLSELGFGWTQRVFGGWRRAILKGTALFTHANKQ